jgi:hypothetical protein
MLRLKVLLPLVLFVVAFPIMGAECEDSSTDAKVSSKQETMVSEANRQVGMPAIVNWQERKLMRRIYEMRDQENLITWTYIVDLNGKLHFLTRSIGYGLPYGTQFSNPERTVTGYQSICSIAQAEPNGLFMPSTADATWIIAIDDKGETFPMYVEPRVIVSPRKLDGVN